MKTWTNTYELKTIDDNTASIFTEDSFFYDIETTGLMSKRNHIYLIGCAHRIGNHVTVTQFFSENNQEESLILTEFLSYCKHFSQMISFNGIGFDLPFIIERCKQNHILEQLNNLHQLDIFRRCKQLKKYIVLDSYKQKSIETFLGIQRDDQYNGGQLIEVYHNYVKCPTPESMQLLKLHNYEDVIGMIDLFPILSYEQLLQGIFIYQSHALNQYLPYGSDTRETELIIHCELPQPIPGPIRLKDKHWYAAIDQRSIAVSIHLFTGELKYFFENYKDYDYLPDEDMAIHKSISSYMDKAHKQPATKKNCYTRTTGVFLPVPKDSINNIHYFQKEYADKTFYLQYDEAAMDEEFLIHLIQDLLV